MRSNRKSLARAAESSRGSSDPAALLRAVGDEHASSPAGALEQTAPDEYSGADIDGIGARELAELTARGSHLRRVRRRTPRARSIT
ncbi:MAG: hypothetical protein M3Y87_32720, partial [Myxococcota bacterium]|nr:hypothetical protein [Myxococcota bacterium]